MTALYWLDAMFTGQEIYEGDITDESIETIDFCIKYSLNEKDISHKPQYVDNFMLDNVYGFCQKKTKANLWTRYFRNVPVTLQNIVFYGCLETKQVPDDKTNIFRAELFVLFPHLVEMLLFVNNYALNLLQLLAVLDEAVIPQSFEVLKLQDYSRFWMKKAFEAAPDIEEQYRAKNWSIELQNIGKSDWIFIRKLQ